MMSQPISSSLRILKSRLFEMNSGAFVHGREAYLVDPGIFPDEIDRLVTDIGQPTAIKGIIITHSHWDHILGPERLPGVPVIAHPYAAASLANDTAEVSRTVHERLAAEGSPRETQYVAPSVDIIADNGMELPLGNRTLQLLHAPGHCADQLVIYDASERVLWAADMLSDFEIPFVDDVRAYRQTIERLRTLDIDALVPGHGNPTSDKSEIEERLAWDHKYLVRLEEEVTASVHARHTLAHTQHALADWPLRRPDINSREHLRNIETVYCALSRPS